MSGERDVANANSRPSRVRGLGFLGHFFISAKRLDFFFFSPNANTTANTTNNNKQYTARGKNPHPERAVNDARTVLFEGT